MNNLTINGYLVRDMEIKDVKGLLICEFTIANVESEEGYKTYVSCIVNELEIEKFVSAEEQPKKSSKYNKYKK